MRPPVKKMEFEKISTSDFVTGTIEDILYDQEHSFKGFGKDSEGKQKPDTIGPAVRLVFTVDGYKFPHKTPWMKFSYSAKSKLFSKYIVPLVQNAVEYFDMDLDQLKGLKVRMLWVDNGEFQNIETLRPADGKKIIAIAKDADIQLAEAVEVEPDESPT